ncbi:MAG: L-type lectin-domain containing protein [Myxococcota bacterium]
MHVAVSSLFCVLLAAPATSLAQTGVHDFRLGGSAFIVSQECIRLTPDRPYVSGSAWFKQPVDLREPFEIRMSLVLGRKDQDGADGVVFVLHPFAQTGLRGEGMGFAGLIPSMGIEFDTYQNLHLGDPRRDHLAMMTHGRRAHREAAVSPLELENLEDGARHPLRIAWAPRDGRLEVVFDDGVKATYRSDIVQRVFNGQSVVYWGLTAGTGRLSNEQDVCFDTMVVAAQQ